MSSNMFADIGESIYQTEEFCLTLFAMGMPEDCTLVFRQITLVTVRLI